MRDAKAVKLLLVLLVAAVVLSLGATAQACPTCAEGMSHDENAASLIRGYFWSIVFMMSMPFTVLTGIASYFYLQVRRARRLQPIPQPLPIAKLPPGLVLPSLRG